MSQNLALQNKISPEEIAERIRDCEDDPKALLSLAEELAQDGYLDIAQEIGVILALQNDQNAEAWNLLGFISFAQGDLTEAKSSFERACSIDPDNADAAANLADVCEALGLTDTPTNQQLKIISSNQTTKTDQVCEAYPPLTPKTKRTKSAGKISLVVCLYEDNFGDKLIYQTIDKKLRHYGFDTEPIEISQALSQSQMIEKANSSDFLYFVGGGIIERWAPEIITNFDKLHKNLHVPYGIVGLSTGNFDYSDIHSSLKIFCDHASFFYTRDEESVETFKKAGAEHLPIAAVDVVLANSTIPRLHRTGNTTSASFRNIPYTDITGDLDWNSWSRELKDIGVTSLIPDCHDAQKNLRIPINPDPVLLQLTKSGIVIAMRYHIILTAAMLGVVPIPIDYCPKVRRLAEQLGIEDYCLGIHDYSKLKSTFSRIKMNEQTIREQMFKRINTLRSKANELIEQSILTMEQVINER